MSIAPTYHDVLGANLRDGDYIAYSPFPHWHGLAIGRIIKCQHSKAEVYDAMQPHLYTYPPKILVCSVIMASRGWTLMHKRKWISEFKNVVELSPDCVPVECKQLLAKVQS